ncbi:hypothetical protein [Ktedonobacter racemifer]|uniref:Uncharacterized protein n=1 Tax=Ktedonobacter racemifer DSM 44963 TaxID=485913 RepID=D6TNC8_KTERA|nr:hypothetical protein [Ktedonobacter racemifer]EFH87259.1 hypothetical protein Krac_8589 [Ktedonobacter racemifer DSM 44963]
MMPIEPKPIKATIFIATELLVLVNFFRLAIVIPDIINHLLLLIIFVVTLELIFHGLVFFLYRILKKRLEKKRKNNQPNQ